jgi:hypothetical protein
LVICRAHPAARVEPLCAVVLRAAFAGNAHVAATHLVSFATDARALAACRHDAVTIAAYFAGAVAIFVLDARAFAGYQAPAIAADALGDTAGAILHLNTLMGRRALPAAGVQTAGAIVLGAADASDAGSATAD